MISNIKSNSNWPWQKLTLLIQVMKNPRIVLASVKTKSHDSDNVIKVIVIYFSIWGMSGYNAQIDSRALRKKIIKVMIYEEGRRKSVQYFLTY